ncbi:MAG: hypothetical protein AB8H80_03615 [Planctomycetota bacterium]
MSMRSKALATASVLFLATLSSGCAWSNRINRPVWNAFDEYVVPDSEGWFLAMLPLTVPMGLAAIVADVVVAHPIQVLDDSFGDAMVLWKDDAVDFEHAYFTEMGFLLPRAAFTPVVFLAALASRSIFDIPRRLSEEELLEARKRREELDAEALQQTDEEKEARAQVFIEWLDGGCALDPNYPYEPPVPSDWRDEFVAPMERALSADALTRRRLHISMISVKRVRFGGYSFEAGLRDADAVVRFATLDGVLREGIEIPAGWAQRLREDPSESVRERARGL